MKILSIDVGIKNLAMCILKTKQLDDMSESMFCIEKWEVINLCSDDHACHWKTMEDCTSENKYLSQCNKKAFYTKNKEYRTYPHSKHYNKNGMPEYTYPYNTLTKSNVKSVIENFTNTCATCSSNSKGLWIAIIVVLAIIIILFLVNKK